MTGPLTCKSGEVMTLHAKELSLAHDDNTHTDKITLKPCPVDFSGDAVIRFYVKKKAFFYTMRGIKTLVPVAYP